MLEFPNLPNSRRALLTEATENYYLSLRSCIEVQNYLKLRGITGEVAQHFRLGAVVEPVANHSEMQGMLSIPYITPTGVSAVRFRRIHGDGNKYHQETGSLTPLFNVRDLHRPEHHVAVCEGELDAVVMSGLVGVPAVAIAGTGQWTKRGKYYRRLLQDYDRVFVVMDPDDKGQQVAEQIIRSVLNPVNVVLPGDVNETFLAEGRDYILGALGLWQSSEIRLAA